jgi:hypothetical protein
VSSDLKFASALINAFGSFFLGERGPHAQRMIVRTIRRIGEVTGKSYNR